MLFLQAITLWGAMLKTLGITNQRARHNERALKQFEIPRVGGSIPPLGTTFQNNINDLVLRTNAMRVRSKDTPNTHFFACFRREIPEFDIVSRIW